MSALHWQDVLVLVDNGRAPVGHYVRAGALIAGVAEKHPDGIGVLTIIPEDAAARPEPVRKAINEVLARHAGSIRCLAWMVEGRGFQGAMVRAVCTGLRVFYRHPYPTQVTTDLSQSMSWMIPLLSGGPTRRGQVIDAATSIRTRRARGEFATSF